jgi:hypothetical protein
LARRSKNAFGPSCGNLHEKIQKCGKMMYLREKIQKCGKMMYFREKIQKMREKGVS